MQAARLAAKAKAVGYNALALQLDYPTPPGTTLGALWELFRDACGADILPGAWVTQPWSVVASSAGLPPDTAFLIVEDERPDQRAWILQNISLLKAFGVPVGVVTNGHYDPSVGVPANHAEWAPIKAAGFAYLGEVYARTDGGAVTGETLASMQYRAGVWQDVPAAATAPVYGRFGGATYTTYNQAERASQQAFWDWPVEGVLVNA